MDARNPEKVLAERMEPSVAEKPETSGFPLEIVEGKPDEKFCCSHCKLLLRDPMQNCCGHRFCTACVEVLQTLPQPVYCELCKEEDIPKDESILKLKEMFDDKAARREMKKLKVKCVAPGCEWKGVFDGFIKHDETCVKKVVPCGMCHKNVSKVELEQHISNSCPKRSVPCEYCHEMIVFDCTKTHHKICSMYVIRCEGCDMKIARKDITEHEKKTCTNRMITCPMPTCNIKLPLDRFQTHLSKENLKQEHIAFLLENVSTLQSLLETLTIKCEQHHAGTAVAAAAASLSVPEPLVSDAAPTSHLDGSVEIERSAGDGAQADTGFQTEDKQKLKLHEDLMSVLHGEILRCISKGEALDRIVIKEEKRVRDLYEQYETVQTKITDLEKKYTEVAQHIGPQPQFGELSSEGNGIFLWRMSSFSEVRRNACNGLQMSVSSPCFFSQPSGYNMRLTFYSDGRSSSKGKSLSLFLEVVPGPYDDLLVWPFTGKVHFMLIDQKDFVHHHVKLCLHGHNIIQRPTSSDSVLLGMDDFIIKENFARNLSMFVVKDTVYFKVCVETSEKAKERIALLDPRRAVFPVN